ncbi:hypothetical protein C5167_030647 [Papaver somniferum]|nr:hypothetical protein C5167_030647 [Papaver somniferum]
MEGDKKIKEDEVVKLLSPPKDLASTTDTAQCLLNLGGVIRKMLEDFVEAILSSVRETLFTESLNQKVRSKKRLSKSTLDESSTVGPVKASREKVTSKEGSSDEEERKAAVVAAGLDWHSDDSDEESRNKH